MFYISAWINEHQDASLLEESVPLLFSAKRLRALGSKAEVTVLFLAGYDRLPATYVADLERSGLHVLDFAGEIRKLEADYSPLSRFGSYEQMCFLRWLALDRHLEAERVTGQVFHVDGDVVLGVTPEQIAGECAGRTFVLQGCPAFTAVADRDWFRSYEEQLQRFSHDIDGYSATAWGERDGWRVSHLAKWAGSRNRRTISSDQDLMSHLIHTGRIPQSDPVELARGSRLYWMENPLYLHSHAQMQLGKTTSISFRSDGERCYVDGKQVALWHFQGYFVRYLNQVEALRRIGWPLRVPNDLESSRIRKPLAAATRLGSLRSPARARAAVYRSLREINPGRTGAQMSLADVFNRRTYWKSGVFSDASSDLDDA